MDTRDGVAKDENSNVSNEMITLAGDALEPLRCSSGQPYNTYNTGGALRAPFSSHDQLRIFAFSILLPGFGQSHKSAPVSPSSFV
jgi:hypothetical protein